MKKTLSPQEWAQEFREFLTIEPVQPKAELSQKILSRVQTDLNPSAWMVFPKIALIHAFVGALSLLLCPQFGVSPNDSMGVMAVFMKYGEHVCMLACGGVFLGGSALAASLILRPEEIRTLRRTELFQFFILSLLSVAVFLCTGATVVSSMMVIWLAGSVLGALTSLELGWFLRKKLNP